MNDIALYFGDVLIYRHGIIMVLAVAAAVLCAVCLRRRQGGSAGTVLLLTAVALPAGLLLSRVHYWLHNIDHFSSLGAALLHPGGGNSLLGAAVGVLAAVCLLCKLGYIESLPRMLDCLAPSAALGICIGRLAGFFSGDDRGTEVMAPALQRLPFAVWNEVTGKWNIAVFLHESICAGVLFAVTLALFRRAYGARKGRMRPGDVTLLFMAGFGMTQGVLESWRSDSLFLIGLGFVRVLQITALVCIVLPAVVFCVRAARGKGVTFMHILRWVLMLALLALAFWMEMRMTSDVFARNYSIMAACLGAVTLLSVLQYAESLKRAA